MKITKSTWPIKVGAVAGLCLLFGIVYVLNPAFWGELWDVCLSGDMHRIALPISIPLGLGLWYSVSFWYYVSMP